MDGTLRWILTPKRGKVYFLSPVASDKNRENHFPLANDFPNGARNMQCNPKGDSAYIARLDNKEQFFVNNEPVSILGHQGLGPCIIDKLGRPIMQLKLDGKGVLMLGGKVVSQDECEEVGAWQLDPEGKIVIAEKINGKWGVYSGKKLISPPDCRMVWGWQVTYDGKLVTPLDYEKGGNITVVVDGKQEYDGKGTLLTWHYENKNLWIVAIENNEYCFYRNQELVQKFPAKLTLTRWEITSEGIRALFDSKQWKETPRTCHPTKEYVATNEWWYG